MRMPRGGRLLITVNAMPRARRAATTARARSVNTLSEVTSVPSTSEIRADIFAGGGKRAGIGWLFVVQINLARTLRFGGARVDTGKTRG
jgi:hypothetical protein